MLTAKLDDRIIVATGSREQIMDVYRQVRDGLARRIKDRLDWKPQGSL